MEEGDPVEFHDRLAEDYLDAFSEPSDYLENFLQKLDVGSKVLDAGCGAEVDTSYIASEGFEVIGVDLSDEMLRVAQENFGDLDFRKQDLRNLDFPENSFDGIVASFSLIYLEKSDVPKALEDFREMIKDDGLLFISVQIGESRELLVDDPVVEGDIFMNVVTKNEIHKLLTENGFKVMEEHQREPKSPDEFNFNKLYIIAEAS
ncbi:MAG: class I SAM-dependent methyltransferase [Candidatus Nanohalobium sp.]